MRWRELALLVGALGACTADRPAPGSARAGAASDGGVARGAAVRIEAALPDPAGARDDAGEWVRLRNTGDEPAALGGWRLASGGDAGFTFPPRTRLAPGAALTLARSTDPRRNGGVAGATLLTGVTLGNRADWLALRDARGRTVDSLGWSSTRPGEPVQREPGPGAAPEPAPVPAPSPSPAAGADTTRAALEVRVLDVGQGDAILVRSGGSVALVDGGPDAAALGRHLDALGVGRGDTIALVVLSHAHADHYAGLHELFRSRRALVVRYFVENGDPTPNAGLRRLRDSVAARVRRGTLVYRDADDPCGDGRPVCTFTLRGGAKLHVMRPDSAADGPNDRSVPVKIVSADSGFSMWLAGDAERPAIAWLLQRYGRAPGMDVDVLKADHHGSCNGVTPEYLARTSPAWAVASLGAVNDYGHMHEQAKAIYRAAGVPWYRTDQNGTVTIRVPGAGGARYAVSVERGTRDMNGPSDRPARCR